MNILWRNRIISKYYAVMLFAAIHSTIFIYKNPPFQTEKADLLFCVICWQKSKNLFLFIDYDRFICYNVLVEVYYFVGVAQNLASITA